MEGKVTKIERLQRALKAIENLGGVGQLVLEQRVTRQRERGGYIERWDEWEAVFTAFVGRAYANRRVACALMVAAGLDPDGKDGVRLQIRTDDKGKIRF